MVMMERRANLEKREQFELLRSRLRHRLERICAHFPQAEFENLTARMTRLRLKYDPVSAVPERDRAY